jgi:hypothetical protein
VIAPEEPLTVGGRRISMDHARAKKISVFDAST